MSPLFSDLLRLKNVPGARVCQEITLDTMLGAAGEDFKGSYGPDGLTNRHVHNFADLLTKGKMLDKLFTLWVHNLFV